MRLSHQNDYSLLYIGILVNIFIARKQSLGKVICLQVCVCPWGGAWLGGSDSGGSGPGGCLLWGLPALGGGVLVRGMPGGDPPTSTAAGQYASYWNAFLFIIFALYSVPLLKCTLLKKKPSKYLFQSICFEKAF